MNTTTRTAPAKINLGLDIVGTRQDGYHLLETVFQTISICDRVTVTRTETPGITLQCTDPAVPCDQTNLAWKAAAAYQQAAALSGGVAIQLEKHIPAQAGMGGGSTDGAAVLLALQELTGNGLPEEQLLRIAVRLGADVPFFLYGGTAWAEGIGEKLETLPFFDAAHLVIAKGVQGVSTAEAYRNIDALTAPIHPPVRQLRDALRQRAPLETIASYCGNLFESAVSLPEIAGIRDSMRQAGALCSVMTGSGAAVFGIFPTAASAETAVVRLRQQVPFAVCCETMPGK